MVARASRSLRLGRHPVARSLFLALAAAAAACGFPIKVEPPPQRRTPVAIVREGDPPEPEDAVPGSVA